MTFGSVGPFLLALTVIGAWTGSATSDTFVLFPVTTLVLEAILLAEPSSATTVAAALVVVLGVWFGAFTDTQRRERVRPTSSR